MDSDITSIYGRDSDKVWGGQRSSEHIQRKPASNLHHAVRFATFIGSPLNYHVTINFDHTPCSVEAVSRQFEMLRKNHFGPWLRRPGKGQKKSICPPTFVWVIENAGGQTAAHWLVHLPPGRIVDFRAHIARWVSVLTGGIITADAIRIDVAYAPHPLSHYMLKGVNPACADHFGVRAVPQGTVYGKRSGFSRNLGPAARRKTAYRPRRDFHIWHKEGSGRKPVPNY